MIGFRAASELFLLMGIMSLLPLDLPLGTVLLLIAICTLGCTFAFRFREKPVLRFGCALIPPLALLPAGQEQLFLFILPVAYSEMLICTDRMFASYWSYARHMKLSLFFAAFCIIIAGIQGKDGLPAALLLLGYMIAGVCFLRQTRLGGGVGGKGRVRDFLAVIGVPAVIGLVGAALIWGADLYAWVFLGFARVIGYLFQLFVGLFVSIPIQAPTEPATEPTAPTRPDVTAPAEYVPPATEPGSQGSFVIPDAVFAVLAVAALLALAAGAVYCLMSFLKRPAEAEAGGSTWTDESQSFTRFREEKRQVESNRRRIRKIYGKYLTLMASKGYHRNHQDTSLDILNATFEYAAEEPCEQLRRLYIRARYCTGEKVTAEDVQLAKTLYGQIKDGLIAQ